MILTADSATARQTNKRRANEGWNTLYIGANRFTRKPDEPAPSADALFPVAFLVEKEPGAIVRPHFHQAEQYQVVVGGGGKFGVHDIAGVVVHYTGPYTAYGPLVAADKGLDWFTLRNGWDPGARYMPAERQGLREGRARYPHREATAEVPDILSRAALARLGETSCEAVLPAAEDGVATWRYRIPPGARIVGPEPALGGGQFWLVLSGGMTAADGKDLDEKSCVFVPPEDAALALLASPSGVEVLCMQFALRARH